MKESINTVKKEAKAKLLFWNNIQSKKLKIALILGTIAIIGIKIFTTILTFDWLSNFFA